VTAEPFAADPETRARWEALRRRLAALGIESRLTVPAGLSVDLDGWEALLGRAESAAGWQATAEEYADPAEAARTRRALREADGGL
jgi:hypothetical protein